MTATPVVLLMLLASTLVHARPIAIQPAQASHSLGNETTVVLPEDHAVSAVDDIPSWRYQSDIVRTSGKPMMGSSCATVTPGQNEKCCATKAATNMFDSWCVKNFRKT